MENEVFKYVWLNLNTGEFSRTWDEETQNKYVDSGAIEAAKIANWKLIKYRCLSDDVFEFYDKMKVVTNTTNNG